MLAHHTLSRRPVFADDTWASVYRAGDYCMPHSHLRANASIVYMLDVGDGLRWVVHLGMSGRFCVGAPPADSARAIRRQQASGRPQRRARENWTR